ELLHREDADYAGAVPMVGFGAGAYALALMDRAEGVVGKTDPCFPKEGPDVIVPEPEDDAGAPTDADAHADADGGPIADAVADSATEPDAAQGGGNTSSNGCSCHTGNHGVSDVTGITAFV